MQDPQDIISPLNLQNSNLPESKSPLYVHVMTLLSLASFPVLHHSYRRLQYATIAVVEDWERGYLSPSLFPGHSKKAGLGTRLVVLRACVYFYSVRILRSASSESLQALVAAVSGAISSMSDPSSNQNRVRGRIFGFICSYNT